MVLFGIRLKGRFGNMGTRSLTFVYGDRYGDKLPLINMYRQFDGYPHGGHGQELAEFLAPIKICNGISGDPTDLANGMGCLAAQIVMHFKSKIEHHIRDKNWKEVGKYNSHVGGIYLYRVTSTDCGQDYEYHVWEDKIEIICQTDRIFIGTWAEFLDYCSKPQEKDEE
jgi:hypothetical protein